MNRRGFLTGMAGILAAGVAPAAIGSDILMPVRKLWVPETTIGWISVQWVDVLRFDRPMKMEEIELIPPPKLTSTWESNWLITK